MTIRIIACNVFRDMLGKTDGIPGDARITFIPSFLHLRPMELKKRLLSNIRRAHERDETVGCLFGVCFPDMERVLKGEGARKICGHNCYQMLLGSRRFEDLMEEHPGVYFLEKELVENFEEYCVKPLELDDPLIHEMFFRHYRRAVYIRQTPDRELTCRAREIARRLSLEFLILDADYTEFGENLKRLVRSLRGK